MRTMRRWVCIAGSKGSGKDTFGNFFVEKGYTKINFADNLKEMLTYAFKKDKKYFYDPDLKDEKFDEPIVFNEQHIARLNMWIQKTHSFTIPNTYADTNLFSPRNIMQFIGTDIIRHIHNPYHVEATIPKITKLRKMICCDVRFENELLAIKEAGRKRKARVISLYIKRPGYGNDDQHASEIAIKESMMGVTVENGTTIEDLGYLAEAFIGE